MLLLRIMTTVKSYDNSDQDQRLEFSYWFSIHYISWIPLYLQADLGSGTVNGNQDEAGASLQTDDIIGDAVPAGKDLRELLKERRAQSSQKQDPKEKQRNKRLFSSAAAGILPSFLQSKIGGKSDNAEVKTDENLHGDQDQQKPVENQDQGPMPMEEWFLHAW